MSYRAFKRLLGETSLERKCRFLLGGFILVLISGSFWLYAWQTEHLAYDQLTTTCRLLVTQIVDRQLATGCRSPPGSARPSDEEQKRIAQALDQFREKWEKPWPEEQRNYHFWMRKPNARPADAGTDDGSLSQERLKEFLNDRDKQEDYQLLHSQGAYYYYGAVRASAS